MPTINSLGRCALAAAVFLVAGHGGAAAQSFEDRTIEIVIPYGPGGAYDKYGQTFAADLKKRRLRPIPSDGAKIQQIVVQAVAEASAAKNSRPAPAAWGEAR